MSNENYNEVGLLDLWYVGTRYKGTILGITAAAVTIAVLVAVLSTPIYRAETLLAPVADDSNSSALASLRSGFAGLLPIAGLGTGVGQIKEQAIATLSSRAFTVQFIRDHGLMPILFEDLWDAESQSWQTEDPKEAPTYWQAYEVFDESVRKIDVDPATGLITLSIEWKDNELAAKWANLLVQRVNQRMRQRAIEEAQRSIDYLSQELEKTSIVELQQSIYELIEEQIKRIMLANVRDEYAFQVVDPAAIPDDRYFVRPKRIFIVIVGALLGAFAGIFAAFAAHSFSKLRIAMKSRQAD